MPRIARHRFTLTIEPEADPVVPVYVRLRRCLKTMLRAFGLRVTDYRELPPEPPKRPPTKHDQEPRRAETACVLRWGAADLPRLATEC